MINQNPTYDELISALEASQRKYHKVMKEKDQKILELEDTVELLQVTKSAQKRRLFEFSNLTKSFLEDEVELERTKRQIEKITKV